jgi:hypothetical protein
VRDLRRGGADRVVPGRLRVGMARVQDLAIGGIAFHPLDDVVHHRDRLDRILAGGGSADSMTASAPS